MEKKHTKKVKKEVPAGTSAGTGTKSVLPSTEQATDVLRATEKMFNDITLHPPAQLDPTGKRLATDLANITSTQRRFLEEKNPDSLIQQIMEDGRLALQELNRDIKTGKLKGVDKDKAMELSDQASTVIENLQALALELITSGNFRKNFLEFLECLILVSQEVTGLRLTGVTEHIKDTGDMLKEGQNLSDFVEGVKGRVSSATTDLKDTAKTVQKGEMETYPLTKQQENELTDKTLNVLSALAMRPKSRNAIKGLFGVMSTFARQYAIQTNAKAMKNTVEKNIHLTNLAKHSRMLMERFTGKETMDELLSHVKAINKISYHDSEVLDYFHKSRDFFVNVMDNPTLLKTSDTRKDLKRLIRSGRRLSEKKELREHFIGTLNASIQVIKNVSNDPHLAQIQSDIRQFINDLVRDQDGNFVLSRHSLNQLKVILVSAVLERMTIPIPTVRSSDDKMEFEVSNLFLTIRDVIPDMIHLEFMEKLDLDTRDLQDVRVSEANQLMFYVNNIRYNIKDANLWFKRKKFPKAEDSGLLAIDMPGDGLGIKVVMSVTLSGPSLLKVKSVDCNIDKLAIKLAGTKHDKIYNAALRIAKGPIKKRVETAIEDKIEETIDMLNTEVFKQVSTFGKAAPGKIAAAVERKTAALTSATTSKKPGEPIVYSVKEKEKERVSSKS